MKLSIIIPCYKVEQFLNQCLESVCRQKSDEVEVVLVDDGSPDNIPQMCDEWAKKDSRIKVIHQNNGGLSVARNTGLDNSTGEYVWFVDSDDWIVDNAIQQILSLILKYPDISVFTFPLLWSYSDVRNNWVDIKIEESMIMDSHIYMSKFPKAIGATPRNVIKRSFLERNEIRFYPNILHEDYLFGRLLFWQANSIYLSKDSLYYYRQRVGSIMHTADMRRAYSAITIHKQLMLYMDKHIAPENHLSFRKQNLFLFPFALRTVWQIRNSTECKKFLSESKTYRIEQCQKCFLKYSRLSEKWNLYMLAYHPVGYIYFHEWRKMLIKKVKKNIKRRWGKQYWSLHKWLRNE